MLTARLVEESERRAAEANKLKDELLKAREAEKQAKEKLLDFLSRSTSYTTSVTASPISVSYFTLLKKIIHFLFALIFFSKKMCSEFIWFDSHFLLHPSSSDA